MEIDLGELEQFEKRLADKRLKQLQQQQMPNASAPQIIAGTSSGASGVADDLDEYLDRLAIDIKTREAAAAKHNESDCDNNSSDRVGKTDDKSVVSSSSCYNAGAPVQHASTSTSLPLLLFSFFSVLIFIQSVISNRKQIVDGPSVFI